MDSGRLRVRQRIRNSSVTEKKDKRACRDSPDLSSDLFLGYLLESEL